jgi:hypothetical protein
MRHNCAHEVIDELVKPPAMLVTAQTVQHGLRCLVEILIHTCGCGPTEIVKAHDTLAPLTCTQCTYLAPESYGTPYQQSSVVGVAAKQRHAPLNTYTL